MKEVKLSDEAVVARILRGERELYRLLVEKYQPRARKLAFEILRSREDAEDVTQESFVKAFLSLSDFKGESSFYTWLYRIVYNMAVDLRRKHARRGGSAAPLDEEMGAHEALGSTVGSIEDPATALQRKELRHRIAGALGEMSEEHRAVVVLREWEGMSYEDIARVTGVQVGTVMSRLHYARKRLQRDLNVLGPSAPHENDSDRSPGVRPEEKESSIKSKSFRDSDFQRKLLPHLNFCCHCDVLRVVRKLLNEYVLVTTPLFPDRTNLQGEGIVPILGGELRAIPRCK